MIDLVSTRAAVDPQSAACARLLGAIVGDAIRGACLKPYPDEYAKSRNVDRQRSEHDPLASIWFLFDDESDFPVYARLMGIDAQVIREQLLSMQPMAFTKKFTDEQRKILQLRYEWFLLEKQQAAAHGGKFVLQRPAWQDEDASEKFENRETKKKYHPPLRARSIWDHAANIATTQEQEDGIQPEIH